MEEENNPLWPWILGFIAYKANLYIDHFYDDDVINDYFEEEWVKAQNLEIDLLNFS